jgi:hypothetical protein
MKMFLTMFYKQLAAKTMYEYGGYSQGNSPSHQASHVVFIW